MPPLVWPAAALGLLLVFNAFFTPGFFALEVQSGGLYGALVDILNHGSRVVILAAAMTLVIATRGVDLSVGAVMAIAAAVGATLAVSGSPFVVVLAAALGAAGAAGLFNGVLIACVRIQPIVATLVLMVCGRGIAELITSGRMVTFTQPEFVALGNGRFLGLPIPVFVAAGVATGLIALTRWTGYGLMLEAMGSSPAAARAAGVRSARLTIAVYVIAGVCAGLAGLIAAGNIKGADATRVGLTLELDAILAVVLGGTALAGGRFTILGSVVGAILIQTITTTLYMKNVSSDIAPLPKAVVVLAVCIMLSPVLRAKTAMRRGASMRVPTVNAAGGAA